MSEVNYQAAPGIRGENTMTWPTADALALRDQLASEGNGLLQNENRLHAALQAAGVSQDKILAYILYLHNTPFLQYLGKNSELDPVEINNLILGAAGCGLSDHMTRIITAEMLFAAGLKQDGLDGFRMAGVMAEPTNFYIPSYLYEPALKEIAAKDKSALTSEDTEQLEAMVRAGIPGAKYLKGLFSVDPKAVNPREPDENFKLLLEAAADGNGEASLKAGDIYYDHGCYLQAYNCYVKPGVPAGDGSIHKKMNWLNYLSTYGKQKQTLWYAVFGAMTICMALLLFLNMSAGHVAAFVVAEAAAVGVMVYTGIRLKADRFTPTEVVGTLLFLIFAVFFCIII